MAERGSVLKRRLDFWLGVPLVATLGLVRYLASRTAPAEPRGPDTVAVLCFGAIGDLLLTGALLDGLRRAAPHARICMVVSRGNAPALPLVPHIDTSAVFSVGQVHQIVRHVRALKADLLIDTTQWARLGALVASLSGARCTVGFDTPGQHRAAPYDIKVPHRNDRHEVKNLLELGSAVFPGFSGVPSVRLPSPLPPAPCPGPYVVLHMWPSGLRAHLKEWPRENWQALATSCALAGFQVLFTGSPADAPRTGDMVRTIRTSMAGTGKADMVHDMSGRLSLTDLAPLLAGAAATVSVNTGTMHLAALTGSPTVGLHGPTNPLRWGPLGARTRALLPDPTPGSRTAYLNLGFEYPPDADDCLRRLSPDTVIAALRDLGLAL
ncbi:glycosyltransferase family 9 protein [Nitratidesulfovibrio sp. SRB-5]|uniref:glycosyltransferase family 9 protein n=1 Tax=Nitratidesulfovibrio sp. SRB-5 TaxID=2872636 RepID=UPI0010265D67|nr:glycosyltransferase family 9 protein [Nitratidesulfovibrio sp. SRB-5]MBZ2172269.1 glycosyltransferase family 9 protein [Nitratidesulfovibrio sp. SRB-5]RXF77229.1 glycosyltransferase family 9 protein [Desulfovibrio sp. DS-1]